MAPGPAPGDHRRGELLAPMALLEGIEFGLCCFGIRGRVDRFDGRCRRLAVLSLGVVQAVANQVHDARLQIGRWEHRA